MVVRPRLVLVSTSALSATAFLMVHMKVSVDCYILFHMVNAIVVVSVFVRVYVRVLVVVVRVVFYYQ